MAKFEIGDQVRIADIHDKAIGTIVRIDSEPDTYPVTVRLNDTGSIFLCQYDELAKVD